jgi:hypothetical protein
MEAKELRIGNIVDYFIGEDNIEYHPCVIEWEDLKWISEKPEDFNKHHKPIPLTEEWLVKFGFDNIDRTNIYVKCIHKIGAQKLKSLAVYIDENSYTVAIVDYYTGKELTDLLHLDYQYVHQLQNLYFALTGKELEIKEI